MRKTGNRKKVQQEIKKRRKGRETCLASRMREPGLNSAAIDPPHHILVPLLLAQKGYGPYS